MIRHDTAQASLSAETIFLQHAVIVVQAKQSQAAEHSTVVIQKVPNPGVWRTYASTISTHPLGPDSLLSLLAFALFAASITMLLTARFVSSDKPFALPEIAA